MCYLLFLLNNISNKTTNIYVYEKVLTVTTLVAMGNTSPVKEGGTLHIYESMKEDDYSICVLDVSSILLATDEEMSDAVGMYIVIFIGIRLFHSLVQLLLLSLL